MGTLAEEVVRLRKRFAEAVKAGVVHGVGKENVEAILIQVLNEAEKNKQQCTLQVDSLKRQLAQIEGQVSAFSSMASVVYNVINGFVIAAEREEAERARQEAEEAEKRQAMGLDVEVGTEESDGSEVAVEEEVVVEPPKASRRPRRN
jgi:hypothetical protein